jgi:hypothetical protein
MSKTAFVLCCIPCVVPAVSVGKFIAGQITRVIEAPRRKAEEESNELLAFHAAQSAAQCKLDKLETDAKFRHLHSVIAEARESYYEDSSTKSDLSK